MSRMAVRPATPPTTLPTTVGVGTEPSSSDVELAALLGVALPPLPSPAAVDVANPSRSPLVLEAAGASEL